jgi:hypothetical protein
MGRLSGFFIWSATFLLAVFSVCQCRSPAAALKPRLKTSMCDSLRCLRDILATPKLPGLNRIKA